MGCFFFFQILTSHLHNSVLYNNLNKWWDNIRTVSTHVKDFARIYVIAANRNLRIDEHIFTIKKTNKQKTNTHIQKPKPNNKVCSMGEGGRKKKPPHFPKKFLLQSFKLCMNIGESKWKLQGYTSPITQKSCLPSQQHHCNRDISIFKYNRELLLT